MTGDPRMALEQVQLADQRWGDALEASLEAPPDYGFAQRVRAIANAAEQEAAALRHADMLGLAHRPHPGARNMQLSTSCARGRDRVAARPTCWSASTPPSPSSARRSKASP